MIYFLAKPIDLLAKYISTEEEVDAVEMHEPYIYLNGLKLKDLEDLVEDIKVYMELEKGKNFDYWNDITVIVEDELHKMRKMQKQSTFTGKCCNKFRVMVQYVQECDIERKVSVLLLGIKSNQNTDISKI